MISQVATHAHYQIVKMVKVGAIAALVLGSVGAAAAAFKQPPSTLQIGVKEKADPCVATAQNGDNLTMHYVCYIP